jgi:hypothetical protein
MSPPACFVSNSLSVHYGTRREPDPRLETTDGMHAVYVGVGWGDHPCNAPRYINIAIDCADERVKVVRQPKVVMSEISDKITSSLSQAFIVWARLMSIILRKIDPSHSGIIERADDLF